jgi:antitoxin MazE
MKVRIRKWGGSAMVRIPASVMTAAGLRTDQVADIREEGGRIIIEPTGAVDELDMLLDRMTAESFPDDVNCGTPIGHEAW